MSEFLTLIKQGALDAVENAAPCAVMFGKLEGKEPLKIQVEQRLCLGKKQLVVPAALQKMMEDNELNAGDGVLLMRMQGGQKFVVLDKVTS